MKRLTILFDGQPIFDRDIEDIATELTAGGTLTLTAHSPRTGPSPNHPVHAKRNQMPTDYPVMSISREVIADNINTYPLLLQAIAEQMDE